MRIGGTIMKRFWSNYKSTVILLGAVVLGAIAGAIWGTGAAVLKSFGTLFLNLMLVIIVPLIFTTIALSIAKM
jgi:Na+/H+-dicarboxylate symporter